MKRPYIWAAPLFLLLASSVAQTAGSRRRVVISLTSIEKERSETAGQDKVIGNFVARNQSGKDVCLMRDIVANEFSPFVEIAVKQKWGRFRIDPGTPFPPKTRDIMKVRPGGSVIIKRVVAFVRRSRPQGGFDTMRISTIAYRCGSSGSFIVKSGPFLIAR